MRSNLFIIAKSGWIYLSLSLSLMVLFVIIDFDILAFIAFLASLLFVIVFRNPERELLSFEEEAIVSPVDGIVRAIEELNDSEYGYRVEIASSYSDVSLLRSPIRATLELLSLHKGTRLSSRSPLFFLNENATLLFVHSSGNTIKIEHRVTQSFAGLDINLAQGATLLKGSRYGLMPCGVSSIYLPKKTRVNVSISTQVKASETLIGFFS